MKALRLTAGLTVLALLPAGTPARAQGLPSVPVPGTDVSYLCGGGVALDVSYRSRSIAQLTFGGVTYTLARRNFGPPQYGGVIRYSDPVTSWNIGSGGAFLNQNGQTLASGCQPTDGSGGSSTIIPVGPGDGTSTIIPGPGYAPSFPSVPGFGPFGPTPPPSPPAVNTVNYTCDGGRRVAVAYLGSSTAQLFWQGGTDTLYQTESGSGVRYTNGFYTWVTQGNQGFLQQKGLNQPQITVANNCVALGQ